MKLMIGENIRHLRREKDITQEQLAEIMGVSYQSVSRWENGTCYPDMELLPTIAQFFGTTVDQLMGINEQLEIEKVEDYLLRFQIAISVGNVDECICIARAGVAEFPNNYKLLNKLMYALFIAGDEDGNVPNWKENMSKYDAEITALGERIMKYCSDQEIRLEATARLAFQHCEMGRKEVGRALFETLPTYSSCKEANIWWALEEQEKLPFLQHKIKSGYHIISTGLWFLLEGRLLEDEDLLKVYEKYTLLENLIWDNGKPIAGWSEVQINCVIAKIYARLGKNKESLKHLDLALEYARQFDERPESGNVKSFLVGTVNWSRIEHDTDDSRTCCEILRDKWMAASEFDGIRDTKEFLEIVEQIGRTK